MAKPLYNFSSRNCFTFLIVLDLFAFCRGDQPIRDWSFEFISLQQGVRCRRRRGDRPRTNLAKPRPKRAKYLDTLAAIPDNSAASIEAIVRANVKPGTALLTPPA